MDFHVQRGEPIRAELWNALVDALGQAQIFPRQGIRGASSMAGPC